MGALHDVDAWTVVLQEVEIDGGEVTHFMAEIAYAGDGFEEDFRHDDRGACVDVDAAFIERGYQGTEEAEIVVCGGTESGWIDGWVGVGGVCADGQVNGDWDFCFPGLQEQACVGVFLRGEFL